MYSTVHFKDKRSAWKRNFVESDMPVFVTYSLLSSWRNQRRRCVGAGMLVTGGKRGGRIFSRKNLHYASQFCDGLSHLRRTHLIRLWARRLVCGKECTCIGRGEDLHVSQALSLLSLFLFLSLNKQHRFRAPKKTEKNIFQHLKTAVFSLYVLICPLYHVPFYVKPSSFTVFFLKLFFCFPEIVTWLNEKAPRQDILMMQRKKTLMTILLIYFSLVLLQWRRGYFLMKNYSLFPWWSNINAVFFFMLVSRYCYTVKIMCSRRENTKSHV